MVVKPDPRNQTMATSGKSGPDYKRPKWLIAVQTRAARHKKPGESVVDEFLAEKAREREAAK